MKKTGNFSITAIIVAFIGASLLSTLTASAQSDEDSSSKTTRRSRRSLTKEDSSLLSVFEPVAISAGESTVRVQSGTRQIAVGTVVDSSGLILTKASEMRGDLKCRLPNGDVIPASVFGIDTENDLALLKIDADGLAVAPLAPVAPPTRGKWIVSPTDQNGSLKVGVVGVDERKIPASQAFIGIQMLDEVSDGGVLITKVVENTPAQKAKLRIEDVILKIDQVEVKNRNALKQAIGKYTPGTDVALTVKRDDEEMVIKLTLADASSVSPMNNRSRIQNSMGSRLSRRGKNFPRAFQHDMALEAKHCGSPVVDLDGQIVGINIARSGRVSSLAIPIDAVISVIEKLKTGEFSPVKVYASRIRNSEMEIAAMQERLESNKETVEESIEGVDDSSAKIEELERMKREITERIKEVYENRQDLAKKKRVLESKNKEVERSIRKLERQLDAMKAGKKY
ncbi:S1C family serine protease [Mariniblastus fucicola]|uniref:Serine endoprotease n=1 Tax=Mariniblastus fucicola TaxID=980251 RepID=A0A5B9PGQ8_9BACT|nr:PDZ domain-containing protein [Mariniblastus fucicola]QEG23942.1 serine endoprotease [Mariniblastus fucicola]